MAFVVPRRGGRFEIRESIHTEAGPRARSLASFAVLTEAVLTKAARRSSRPFDREAVVASAIRVGARTVDVERAAGASMSRTEPVDFVHAARRFASQSAHGPRPLSMDPGVALEQLLRFADEVRRTSPPHEIEPEAFPVLSSGTPPAGGR